MGKKFAQSHINRRRMYVGQDQDKNNFSPGLSYEVVRLCNRGRCS